MGTGAGEVGRVVCKNNPQRVPVCEDLTEVSTMKNFNVSTLVLLIVGLLIALPAFAAQDNSSASTNTMPGSAVSQPRSVEQFQAFNANDLIGKTVKDKQNDTLAKVEDIVIGKDGVAQFVILARGGFLDIDQKYVPVPFKTFMSDATNLAKLNTDKDVIATLSKKQLDNAPTYSDKKWASMKASQNKICSYYGAASCSTS